MVWMEPPFALATIESGGPASKIGFTLFQTSVTIRQTSKFSSFFKPYQWEGSLTGMKWFCNRCYFVWCGDWKCSYCIKETWGCDNNRVEAHCLCFSISCWMWWLFEWLCFSVQITRCAAILLGNPCYFNELFGQFGRVIMSRCLQMDASERLLLKKQCFW